MLASDFRLWCTTTNTITNSNTNTVTNRTTITAGDANTYPDNRRGGSGADA